MQRVPDDEMDVDEFGVASGAFTLEVLDHDPYPLCQESSSSKQAFEPPWKYMKHVESKAVCSKVESWLLGTSRRRTDSGQPPKHFVPVQSSSSTADTSHAGKQFPRLLLLLAIWNPIFADVGLVL